jgi:UDP-glucose 4-epimerase
MRILITGKNSYIGNSVNLWLNEKEPTYHVDKISLRNIELNLIPFKNYDVVFHVAGIAHISSNKMLEQEYFKVNRDLAIEVAKRAKSAGVKQFIFTSSMAIYGDDRPIGNFKSINIQSPSPTNAYGRSKLDADIAIQKLSCSHFIISILRIPMIYGKSAKGNFIKLVNFSKSSFLLPKIKNLRSVLHVKNLSELVRIIISKKLSGIYYPQDKKYFDTNDFLIRIRNSRFKKTLLIPFLTIPLRVLALFIKNINKIYGNKYYDLSVSTNLIFNYQIYSIDDFLIENNDVNASV